MAGEDADGFIDFGDFVEEAEDVFDDAAEADPGEKDAGGLGGELEDEGAFVVEGEAFGDVEDDGVEIGGRGVGVRASGAEGGVVEQPAGLADHGAELAALLVDDVVLILKGHFEVVGDGLDAAKRLPDLMEKPGQDIVLLLARGVPADLRMGLGRQRCPV